MKKLIFYSINFFCSSHLLVHIQDVMDQKMTGAKKVTLTKNQFFHARQPRGGIF